jgi:hypothetical protein
MSDPETGIGSWSEADIKLAGTAHRPISIDLQRQGLRSWIGTLRAPTGAGAVAEAGSTRRPATIIGDERRLL